MRGLCVRLLHHSMSLFDSYYNSSGNFVSHHFRPNSAQCPIAGLTAQQQQDGWKTSVPLQDITRAIFNDFTTRRSNNFVWHQTTFKPWYPGIRSNSIDSPKQQGLFSKSSKATGNIFLFLSILLIPLLF